jgi:hypothetical protein
MNARRFIAVVPLIVAVMPVAALARDCNEVKAEIDAKITVKGVTGYVLEVVDTPKKSLLEPNKRALESHLCNHRQDRPMR